VKPEDKTIIIPLPADCREQSLPSVVVLLINSIDVAADKHCGRVLEKEKGLRRTSVARYTQDGSAKVLTTP